MIPVGVAALADRLDSIMVLNAVATVSKASDKFLRGLVPGLQFALHGSQLGFVQAGALLQDGLLITGERGFVCALQLPNIATGGRDLLFQSGQARIGAFDRQQSVQRNVAVLGLQPLKFGVSQREPLRNVGRLD